MVRIQGRTIKSGRGEGAALVSQEPVGFLGGVDPDTGVVVERGHPLEGRSVAGRVLVFPTGKGSTVGSYTLYRLARNRRGPSAIVNAQSEAIVAVGAIISGIPMVDQVDISQIRDGDYVVVEDGTVTRQPRGARELVFVKLGGSIITDKRRPSTSRPEVIARLARELGAALEAAPGLQVVLGHGSGSFGHVAGIKYHVRQGIADHESWWGYAETGAVAGQLNRIVTDAFLEAGVPVVSIQPSASARCQDGQLLDMEVHPIREALRHGLVPLVYGDVALDKERGCTIVSTEEVLAFLARRMHPAQMVMVGEVDGVYDRDPLLDESALPIPRITPATFAHLEMKLGGSFGVDVTGGMLAKVREMVSLVAEGQTERVHLISGWREGALERVLLDPGIVEGTLIEQDCELQKGSNW